MPKTIMVKITSLCTDCLHIITNPLCPYCFSMEVLMWLRDKNIRVKTMNRIRDKLKRFLALSEKYHSDIICIICKNNTVPLCSYCFIDKVEKMLKNEIGKVEGFEEIFNKKIMCNYNVDIINK